MRKEAKKREFSEVVGGVSGERIKGGRSPRRILVLVLEWESWKGQEGVR